MDRRPVAALSLLVALTVNWTPGEAQAPAPASASLESAQRAFYSGQYEQAAATTLAIRTADPSSLAAYELRSSALHFQIKRLMGDGTDRDRAFKDCAACPALLAEFQTEIAQGQVAAREQLAADADDDNARFFLGKIDLNFVWMQLATLGNRTGWDPYWEARKAMDLIIKRHPTHTRARVARAWIDYIVDTRVTWGFRWVLGGGNKKRALAWMRAAATADTDVISRTEARFALWDMLVREKQFQEAKGIARSLATEFPENKELVIFIKKHGG
jgi:hypothetical protein